MEEKTALNWYWWLWLSPVLTVPGFWLGMQLWGWLMYDSDIDPHDRLGLSFCILGSSLLHLILLIPVRHKTSAFVRWHGRQAMLLVGLRTLVPLVFVAAPGNKGSGELWVLSILVLIVIWFVGTLWGQVQAARGRCSLMRWFGRGDAQPAVVRAKQAAQEAAQEGEAQN